MKNKMTDDMTRNVKEIVAIDLFCGIGGLTKGLSIAGINVIAGLDNDESCKFAYETNNDAVFLREDIKSVTAEELVQLYPADSIKVLAGCAPCQPFSRYSSKYRKNGEKDEKWGLLYDFERLIMGVSPDVISMENVPNLRNEKVFKDFVHTLMSNNYTVEYRVVNCIDYGVPQNRKRLVLLASKHGKIKLIEPWCDKESYVSVRDAIGNLPPIDAGETCSNDLLHKSSSLSKKNLERIKQSIPGGTWRDWDEYLRVDCHRKESGRTFPSVYGRMKWDEPSPTITTQFYGYGNGRFGHPEQNRAISLREGAILQSFPTDYVFVDENHPAQKRELGMHIGNAVPVLLGKAIGISIMNHLNELKE